jgi:hypothetical protein
MNNPKDKAEALVNSYRIILMNEDTECGNEILCTSIAKQSALIAVDELIEFAYNYTDYNEKSTKEYLEKVKKEIENL